MPITGMLHPRLTAISPNRFLFIDGALDYLQAYEFIWENISPIGERITFAGIVVPAISALSRDSFAFIDSTNDNLEKYSLAYGFEENPSPAF